MLPHFDQLINKSKPAALLIKEGLKHSSAVAIFKHYYPNVRFVDPSELRLIPSSTSPSGVVVTDNIGEIEQILLELHQEEIEALDEELLVEIGRISWNDLRTVYFVHDKRILGLIRRELPWLLQCGMITTAEKIEIEKGLIETYTPNDEMWSWIADRTVRGEKDKWMLKKCSSAKGDGILFGKDMSEQDWKQFLREQNILHKASRCDDGSEQRDSLIPAAAGFGQNDQCGGDSAESSMQLYLIQPFVKQRKFELIVHDTLATEPQMERARWSIVGSAFGIKGVTLPLISLRANPGDIIGQAYNSLRLTCFTAPGVMQKSIAAPASIKDSRQAMSER